MDHPDEDLLKAQLSLRQFVVFAETLSSGTTSVDDFVRLVLAGRLQIENEWFRVYINARQGVLAPPVGHYQLWGDFDSVIGISHDLPFTQPLAIFPVPSFRETLTKKNHVEYRMPGGFEDALGVSLHKIPNVALGKVAMRQVTRIFFPRLYKPNGTRKLSSEILATIYEKCIRPAALAINPVDQSRWPISFSAAMTLFRDKKGRFHFGSIDFPSRLLGKLGATMLELFQQHEGLKDAFFVHELRGMKGASHHDPTNAQERAAAFGSVLGILDRSLLKPEQWVVDVGMEIRYEGHVLQWLTNGHRRLLEYLLPSASQDQISTLLNSQARYKRDISAQLQDLGGFRASPGYHGKADSVSYMNVYTTDKSVTYQLHDGIFRRRKPWHLFPSYIQQLAKDLKRIAEAFRDCGGAYDGGGLEGNARVEIRVPMDKAEASLTHLPNALVQDVVAAFACDTFWFYKYYRVAALFHVVESLKGADPRARLDNASLAMGAIAIYQLNALIYRPAEGRSETALLEAACQHLVDDEEGRIYPSMYQKGVYFLSDVMKEKSYYLPRTRAVDSSVLLRLYRRDCMEDVVEEFYTSPGKRKTYTAETHLAKKRKVTHKVNWSTSESEGDQEYTGAPAEEANGEAGQGITITGGPTLGPNAERSEVGVILSGKEEAEILCIKRQFPSDVLQLAPSPRQGEEWVLMDLAERQQASINIFKSHNLQETFRQAQYKVMNSGEWYSLVFNRYFPPKGETNKKNLQNFPSAQYYQRWHLLLEETDAQRADIMREIVFKWFDGLYWLPHPEIDRMWYTKKAVSKKSWIMVPRGEVQNCPRLALNPRYRMAATGTNGHL